MKVKYFLFVILTFALVGCRSIVNPGEWVVSTATCWNTMSVTKAGSPIPRLATTCDRMVILPATFMAADFQVDCKFGGESRVASVVKLAYQWRIADPIKFIENAKTVISSPTDSDHKIDVNSLEAIENSVVDKMIMDVIREYTPNKSVGYDELSIEKDLYGLCTSRFQDRGVEFASMSVNVTFSNQIEEALDVISALKFYESCGESQLGRDVIRAKAGAASIRSNVEVPQPKE